MQTACLIDRRAIVVGYGPVGRYVTEELEADGYGVTIIERNHSAAQIQAGLKRIVVAGDAEEKSILQQAGIEHAETLIVTVPTESAAVTICRMARSLNPKVFIAARANHLSYGMLCQQAGADHVIIEEVVAAEAMRNAVRNHVAELDQPKQRTRVKRQAV